MGDMVSLTIFVLGAALFPLLAVLYWRELRTRQDKVGEWWILAFSVAGSVAYLVNLGLEAEVLDAEPAGAVLRFVTSLMAGIVVGLAGGDWRGVAAAAAYGVAVSVMQPGEEWRAPGWIFAAFLGLRSAWVRLQGAHRAWAVSSCAAMALGAAMWLWHGSAWWGVLPDYAMLVLFGATLYYRERLVFFDVVLKQGALVAVSTPLLWLLSRQTGRELLWALPLVIAAPWMATWLGRAVDRLWLGRSYSIEEAERVFLDALQPAATEADLLRRAAASAEMIFRAPVQAQSEEGGACIDVGRRANGVPMMSGDLRLRQSMERTLSVVLENIRFRERQKRQEEQAQQLRLLASRAELKALRAQINPHFLFNALNSIAGLIQDRPEAAEETLEQLAQVFRYTLRNSDQEWVTLGEEIDFVSAYLQVEKARFGPRLEVTVEMDEEGRGVRAPAMCIQPLVENAVRHGASEQEGPGMVAVRVRRDGKHWRIEVVNDGPGFPEGFALQGGQNGHGLRNVHARIDGYYAGEAGLTWERCGGETVVTLRLPAGEEANARIDCG